MIGVKKNVLKKRMIPISLLNLNAWMIMMNSKKKIVDEIK